MGRCVLARDRGRAIALVTAAVGREEHGAADRIHDDLIACLHGNRSATLDLLHLEGAIAEQLLGDDQGRLLEQAAKEVGDSFTNVHVLRAGDPAEQLERILGMPAEEIRAAAAAMPARAPAPSKAA